MHFVYGISLLASLPAILASTVVIDVGEGGNVMSPDSVTADVGDVIEFHFYPGDHSVAQGDYDSPCQPLSGGSGFFSGYFQGQSDGGGDVFQVTINDTNPIWYYCSRSDHCEEGMSGVINPPSSSDTIETYQSDSANADTSAPDSVQGGIVTTAGASSSSSSTSTASSSMSNTSSGSSISTTASSVTSSGEASATTTTSSASATGTSSSSDTNAAEGVHGLATVYVVVLSLMTCFAAGLVL